MKVIVYVSARESPTQPLTYSSLPTSAVCSLRGVGPIKGISDPVAWLPVSNPIAWLPSGDVSVGSMRGGSAPEP